jgi:DUF917 family protein
MGLADLRSEAGTRISLSVVGYDRQGDERLELYACGVPRALLHMLQRDAGESWGALVLACGPFCRQWLLEHGRLNLLSHAIGIGEAIVEIEDSTGSLVASAIGRKVGGQLIASGSITDIVWQGRGARGYGNIHIKDRQNRDVELLFLDRYVALDLAGRRVATFPDLLVTLGIKGTPLSGRELSRGQEVHILMVPHRQRTSQMTARLEEVYRALESITGKSMCACPAAAPLSVGDRRKEVTAISMP